jgi:uracil-DNA glycosylase family 4
VAIVNTISNQQSAIAFVNPQSSMQSPIPNRQSPMTLFAVHNEIISCTRCRRLRSYCAKIAREKKPAYRDDTYWGRPVPGFGDPGARVLVIALAPAAHGANRTGRVFTGDGPGGSSDFLMRAMHASGFASIPTSRHPGDGLELRDAYIAAAVRCAPPGNKPTPGEIAACQTHLVREAAALPNVRVIVALGRIGFDAAWRLLADRGIVVKPKPPFGHGLIYHPPGAPAVIASYHPSRQNTNTGVLTPPMLGSVFRSARKLARS